MQAYDMTSPPVRWNHLPSPQQLPCSRQPGPVSQSAYYSTPHRTVNQRNTYQPVGLHNGHAFGSSFSQPHPSAANLQQNPGSRNDLPVPGSQPAHYSAQQQMVSQWVNLQSRGLSTRQSSQPNSGSATLQSSQASQQHSNSLQRPMLYSISAALKNPCPNVTVLHMPGAHPEASAANYPSQPFHTNTGPQGHNNTAPIQNVQFNANRVWFPQASTNGRPALENNQLRSPVPPRFQSSSGQHNLVQTMYQPAPQPQQTPATSLLPPYRSRHMVMRRSQHNVTQAQNSSPIQDHPQSYRAQNVRQSPVNHEVPTGQSSPVISPSHGPLASSAVQGQAEQRISHSSSSSVSHPQFFGNIIEQVQQKLREAKQCNGVPVSGLQSTINLPLFPAQQHNTQSQGLQPNGTTALLPRTSPNMASLNSSSSQAPLSTHSGPVDYSRVSLLELLLESDDRQVRNQGKSPPSFSNSRAQAVERRGGPQQTASPTTSMAGGSQAHMLHYSAPSNSRTGESPRVGPPSSTGEAISANEGGRLRTVGVDGAQSSRSQTNRSDKQHREVEHCTDPADCLALVLALQRAVRQVHRAVAVVPPISQQADPGQKEDVPASPDDSLPCKIAAVWTLDENGKGMEKDKAEPSVPEEMNKEPSSVTPPQVQEPIKSGKAPIVNSEKTSAGPPSFALPQNRPVAKSHGSQAPICVIDLTENPEKQSNDLDKSCSDYATCDLSTVPVRRFSLEKLQHLVDSLEGMPADKVKHKKMEKIDVIRSILDLYWDGDLRNVLKERNAAKWLDSIATLRVEEPHDHVLEYLEPEKLKRLPGLILKNEISLPTQFKSSWLNLDGQPADIDKVLAEPLSEYDFTWCEDGPVKIRGQDAEDLVVSSQKELSETTSDNGAVNPEHNLVQVGGSNAGNLVVSTRKELKETTSDDTENVCSGSCLSEPASPATDIQSDVVMLKDPVIQKSLENQADPFQGHPKADHPTQQANANPAGLVHSEESDGPSQSNKAEFKKDHSNTRKEAFNPPLSPTTPTESPGVTSQSGDSDHHVESEFDGDLSDASSSDSLLMKVILLTSDDASVIFKKCDKQNEPLQEMSEVLASLSPNQPNDQPGKAVSSPHHAMFTCPHVTDILSDGDHFCSKCWEETPLLDVDLDESLFSPEESEPLSVMSTPIRPVGEAQPCKQAEELTEPACSDNDGTTGSSLVCPSEIDGPEITGDPDEGQNLSPKYVNAPILEPVGPSCSESGSPVGEEVREAYSSAGEESPKAYVQTSGRSLSLSTCRAHKKRKLFKTLSAPEGDGLFRPDVVVNAIHKPPPGVHNPGGDGQTSREEGRPPIKIRIIQTNKHSSRTEVEACKTDRKASSKPHASSPVEPQKLESPGRSPPSSQQQKDGCRKQTGPKKNVKKVKFLLYGSQNSDRDFNHRCHDREKDSSAPVYITVSAATLAGRTYSDVPSAKQKVYSQWSSSFVQKLNSPSRKKHQKTSVRELKSRITMQKQIMKDRAMSKSKGETQLTKGLKRKGHNAPTQEPKKLKSTVIHDYFG